MATYNRSIWSFISFKLYYSRIDESSLQPADRQGMAQERGELPLRHPHIPCLYCVVCAPGGNDAVVVLAPVCSKYFLQQDTEVCYAGSLVRLGKR